jgi:hypothetical protein
MRAARFAPLLALVVAGCLASKTDIALLQTLISSCAFLPSVRATSRTRRGNPSTPSLNGRMRVATTS